MSCEALDFNEEIIKQARKGNKEAFSKIIKINKEYLYKTAFTYVKDEHKALDILQECIYRSFKGIRKLKEPKYFKTWITRILINCCMDYVNKENKLQYVEYDLNLPSEEVGLSKEEKLDLYNALDKLRPEFRSVIILKYFDGLSIKEISEVMNISENTIKSHLSRGKKNLGSILKGDK